MRALVICVLVVCVLVACLLPAQAHAIAAEEVADVQELTIVATGDLLIHQPVWDRALANGNGVYRFRPALRDSERQRREARRLRRSGVIDLIVGQHAHVVQPIRRLWGKFVVYGEGNFLSAQSSRCCPGPTQDGLVAVARVLFAGPRGFWPAIVRR